MRFSGDLTPRSSAFVSSEASSGTWTSLIPLDPNSDPKDGQLRLLAYLSSDRSSNGLIPNWIRTTRNNLESQLHDVASVAEAVTIAAEKLVPRISKSDAVVMILLAAVFAVMLL